MRGETIINGILVDALWMLGAFGVVVAAIAGAWLLFAPAQALAFAQKLNREFSIGVLQRALDEPRGSEPFIYRHHRVIGTLLVLATVYFFWTYATVYDSSVLVAMFDGTLPKPVLAILADVFTVVLVIGNALGFAIGAIMLVRPSLLKSAEALANRWVDTDRAATMLDRKVDRPESFAHHYPRRIGAIILLAAVYIALIWATLLT